MRSATRSAVGLGHRRRRSARRRGTRPCRRTPRRSGRGSPSRRSGRGCRPPPAAGERMSLPVRVSSAPVGSSAKTTSGRATSARAIATRCCWPPESSPGLCPTRSASPTRAVTSASQARSGFRFASRSGSVMFCAAVSDGTRLKDWKTKPIRSRRSLLNASSSSAGEVDVAEVDRPRGGTVEAGGAVQERALPRSRRAHHGGERALAPGSARARAGRRRWFVPLPYTLRDRRQANAVGGGRAATFARMDLGQVSCAASRVGWRVPPGPALRRPGGVRGCC